MSKALPAQLSQFLHGNQHDAHRDYLPDQSTSSSSPSFRHPSRAEAAGDEDFGRFAASSSSSHFAPSSSSPAQLASSSRYAPSSQPLSSSDGAAFQALLASTSLSEDVHGDWAKELSVSQTQPWKLEQETSVPLDPTFDFARAPVTLSGKGKARAHDNGGGDTSPTSAELISSLSSLELRDREYLKSLLAAAPDESVRNYLARGSYADDVYGVTDGVRKVLDQAMEGEGAAEVAGREKAVRRLRMVVQHLWGEDEQATALASGAQSHSGLHPVEQGGGGQFVQSDWAADLTRETNAVPPPSSFAAAPTDDAASFAHALEVAVASARASSPSASASTERTSDVPHFGSEAYLPLEQARARERLEENAESAFRTGYVPLSQAHLYHPYGPPEYRAEELAAVGAGRTGGPDEGLLRALEALEALRRGEVPHEAEEREREQEREREAGKGRQAGPLPPFQDFMRTKLASMGGTHGL